MGTEVRPAHKEEVKEILGIEAGFIGPMGHKIRLVADPVLMKGTYISGANKPGYHVRGIKAGEHFNPDWQDIHVAKEGDSCVGCGSPLRTEKCIEIGNIFKLGIKYSEPLKATYLDEDGTEKPIIMGSYGIGPARIAAAAVEQSNDADGIIWPEAIAPFDVEIIPLNIAHEETNAVTNKLYSDLSKAGIEVLLDDRDLRAGVKFKDADLLGIPRQIVIGERGLKEGIIELKDRKTKDVFKGSPEDVMKKLVG